MSIPFEDVLPGISFFLNTIAMGHLKLCKEAALRREKERGSDHFFLFEVQGYLMDLRRTGMMLTEISWQEREALAIREGLPLECWAQQCFPNEDAIEKQ